MPVLTRVSKQRSNQFLVLPLAVSLPDTLPRQVDNTLTLSPYLLRILPTESTEGKA